MNMELLTRFLAQTSASISPIQSLHLLLWAATWLPADALLSRISISVPCAFRAIDPALQARVLHAREIWEQERVNQAYSFEDSWVGSKLAGYLRAAGYEDIQEKTYRVIRHSPLPANFRQYLQGIAEWFVCEGAPFLANEDVTNWLQCFFSATENVFRSGYLPL